MNRCARQFGIDVKYRSLSLVYAASLDAVHSHAEAPNVANVLFVDDDQCVLDGIVRNLSDDFEVDTASNGPEAIERLKETTYAVVVSDMRMPEMNGATLLKYVFENYPRTVRMLLTGQSDVDDAAAAINEGHIFRLLHKPCSPEALASALGEAIEQFTRSR